MNEISLRKENKPTVAAHARGWQRWAPYAALAWSLIYAGLGIFWIFGGRGFPYAPQTVPNSMGPLIGRFGPAAAWAGVILAGVPAVIVGVLMLRNVRGKALQPLLIAAGALLAGMLLLLMTGLDLLVMFAYIPNVIRTLFSSTEFSQKYLSDLTRWTVLHQILCLLGGFLWSGAVFSYARRSAGACLVCGRGDAPEGWTSPEKAARWGRTAVYVSLAAPIFYALTRFAWVLGIPLGMTEEYLRHGQETGMWVSGLFLAGFGVVGAALTFGLVQRWGEVFPRWMPGLGGRRVPVALAVAPAAIIAVMLVVGGTVIAADTPQMAAALSAGGMGATEIFYEVFFQLGPTLLFPLWGVAVAAAALGYYFRRRAPCSVCGRGAASEVGTQNAQAGEERLTLAVVNR